MTATASQLTITDSDRARHAARPRARFACKASTLDDVRAQTSPSQWQPAPLSAYEIRHVLGLNAVDFDRLTNNLMDDDARFADTGFTQFDCTGEIGSEDLAAGRFTDEEGQVLRRSGYAVVTAVIAPGRPVVLVDCQGYTYPRYCAVLEDLR